VHRAGPDADAGHVGDAALQEAVGETAGRGADVEAVETGDRDGEMVERRGQPLAAAGNEAGGCSTMRTASSGKDCEAFWTTLSGPERTLPSEDQGLGHRPGGREAELHEQLVGAILPGLAAMASVEEARQRRSRLRGDGTDAQAGLAGGATGFDGETERAGHRERIAGGGDGGVHEHGVGAQARASAAWTARRSRRRRSRARGPAR
jgi:hypothetical protein